MQTREKFEEEERKKRSEDEEDSKFDYLTNLVHATKKFSHIRRSGGGAGFKHSVTKKLVANAGGKF